LPTQRRRTIVARKVVQAERLSNSCKAVESDGRRVSESVEGTEEWVAQIVDRVLERQLPAIAARIAGTAAMGA